MWRHEVKFLLKVAWDTQINILKSEVWHSMNYLDPCRAQPLTFFFYKLLFIYWGLQQARRHFNVLTLPFALTFFSQLSSIKPFCVLLQLAFHEDELIIWSTVRPLSEPNI